MYELEQIKKVSDFKSVLLRTVSHELRTPLNAMTSLVFILKKEEIEEGKCAKLRVLGNSCDYLLLLINDLLDFSQIVNKTLSIVPQRFSLQKLVISTIELMRLHVESKGLTIDFSLPNLTIKITSDPNRLKQILFNLIGNAIKFTRVGSIHLVVHCQFKKIKFQIIDTGVGIPADKIAFLCNDPFVKIEEHLASLNPQGCGLGLFISNMLVVKLGGSTIKIKSRVGSGSEFSFSLPYDDTEPERDPADGQGNSESALELFNILPITPQGPVLIVDDGAFNQFTFASQLESVGFPYDQAYNGVEAIEKVLKRERMKQFYCCILMDCDMPILDGWETTSRLLQMQSYGKILNLPQIIGITGYTTADERQKCLQVGMVDILTKPCTQKQLIQTILKHLPSITNL